MLMFNQLVSYHHPKENVQKIEQMDVYSRILKDRGRVGHINIQGVKVHLKYNTTSRTWHEKRVL